MRFENLSGRKYNRLTVLSYSHEEGRNIKLWNCLCDCGKKSIVRGSSLKNGGTKSCGCLTIEKAKIAKWKTHGDAHRVDEYHIWANMRGRCKSKKTRYFKRGITVCDRWRKYENFIADMGYRPSKNHSIERIDNDKGYSPENCKWATRTEQSYNRTSNVVMTHNGMTMAMKQWAEYLGMNYGTLSSRRIRGGTVEQILNPIVTPLIKKR